MLQEHMQYALDTKSVFTPTRQLLLTIGEDLEALDSIYECGLTQERISNDVLSLGKIQLDMMQMCDDDRPVRREAHKITSVFKNEARMKRIALSLDVSPAFDELGVNSIKTDHVRLGQVVTNLLTNAIRFTANSPVRKIELGLDIGLDPPETGCAKPKAKASKSASATQHPVPVPEDTPLYLFVSVSDTGPGLTPHELEMLFQRFSQASPKTHTVYGGSGLGLFVCRKLTELMGGRIDVSSQPGTGSKFSFFITARAGVNTDACAGTPVAPPMSPVAGAAALLRKANVHLSPAGVGRNGSTLPPDTDTAHKWRVLVVEDNLINRTVLIRQLKHVGLEVDGEYD
jgi:signal transduction histidine kinase